MPILLLILLCGNVNMLSIFFHDEIIYIYITESEFFMRL